VSTRDSLGSVTGSAEMPAQPAKLSATLTAMIQRQGNATLINVQYKLSGPADPNATYQFLYELKGGKGKNTGFLAPANMPQPLPGNQIKQQDTFAIPVVVQGQNQYEVIMMEFTQANPKGTRIGAVTGK
jgi:hypothetical protein